METKRKKKILNIIMVLLIALIAVGGFMMVKNSSLFSHDKARTAVSQSDSNAPASSDEKKDGKTDQIKSDDKKAGSKDGKADENTEDSGSADSKGSGHAEKKNSSTSSNENKQKNSSGRTSEENNTGEQDQNSGKKYYCTVSIKCTSILNHLDDLAEGKRKFVPSSGVILGSSSISFSKGDSAYDVTKRACSMAGIQIEAAYTPVYGSYYVEGINHLYEFDCGERSGWLYRVNGTKPGYGSSDYMLKDGDRVSWEYTCTGN